MHWGDSGVTCMITVRRGSWGTWDRTCPGPASGCSTVCSTRFSMGPGSGSTTAFIELRLARWGEPARERTREDRDSRVHIGDSSCFSSAIGCKFAEEKCEVTRVTSSLE